MRLVDQHTGTAYEVAFTDDQAETFRAAVERDGEDVATQRALMFAQMTGQAEEVSDG